MLLARLAPPKLKKGCWRGRAATLPPLGQHWRGRPRMGQHWKDPTLRGHTRAISQVNILGSWQQQCARREAMAAALVSHFISGLSSLVGVLWSLLFLLFSENAQQTPATGELCVASAVLPSWTRARALVTFQS